MPPKQPYRCLSPSESRLPSYLFNGMIVPSDLNTVPGHTFGLYFRLEFAIPQKTLFLSDNTSPSALSTNINHRWIDFRERFAWDFQGDNIYTTLVIVEGRRYVVSGTYDPALPEYNMSIASVGCKLEFKGDIGLCFLAKTDPERFLNKQPDLPDGVLARVLTAYDGCLIAIGSQF
ncbi:hypothetical protein GYMLUDRAFT_60479 [Collybiopsis luxurians FD-317 M1]|uniref:Uncharacterized protein n=1 Tax=Collybiopsis luxurians FD-317 M1 TaxID=944289 RepID=A0A0D0BTF5_9AGAR|nr:hypothetical protein GYMLUDRAFT_60479 [Collybiopsis luxurians FD-317 M1]